MKLGIKTSGVEQKFNKTNQCQTQFCDKWLNVSLTKSQTKKMTKQKKANILGIITPREMHVLSARLLVHFSCLHSFELRHTWSYA